MDQYTVIERLGSGACGAVYLVRDTGSRKLFALKKIDIDERKKSRAKDALLKEANILSKLKHPHVVAFHDSFLDSEHEHVIIIQDFCDGGTLADKIQMAVTKAEHFDEKDIMHWFVQIVMGVQYIHSQKVLHRDLKAENVFLTKKNIVKIGDFGISKLMDNTIDVAQTVVGTPSYLSPELCQDIPYNSKSDMWALGCVLYEMCALRQPFDSNNLLRLFLKIINEKQEPLPDHYSQPLQELVASLLEKSPDNRPSASAILNKAFVRRHLAAFISEKELQQQQQSLRGTSDSVLRSVSPQMAPPTALNRSSLSSCGSTQLLSPQHRDRGIGNSEVQKPENFRRKEHQKFMTSSRPLSQAGDSPLPSVPPLSPPPLSPTLSPPPLSPSPSAPSPCGDGPCSPRSALPQLKRPKLKRGCLSSTKETVPQPLSNRPHSRTSSARAGQQSSHRKPGLPPSSKSPTVMGLSPRSPPQDPSPPSKAPPQRLRASLELNGAQLTGDGLKGWSGAKDLNHIGHPARSVKSASALMPLQDVNRKKISHDLPKRENCSEEPLSPNEADEKASSDYSDDFDETDSDIEEEIAEDPYFQPEESSEGDVEYADDFEEYDDTEELAAIVDLAREAQDVEANDDYFEDPEGHGYCLAQSVDLTSAQQSLLSSSLNCPRARPSLPPLHSPPPFSSRPPHADLRSPIKSKASFFPSSPN